MKTSTAASMAGDALARAAEALRLCADAIAALDMRVNFIEGALAELPHKNIEASAPNASVPAAIDVETRIHVDTVTAARWFNRAPQTLRKWACSESGPVRAVRVHGWLAWSVAEIRAALLVDK